MIYVHGNFNRCVVRIFDRLYSCLKGHFTTEPEEWSGRVAMFARSIFERVPILVHKSSAGPQTTSPLVPVIGLGVVVITVTA